MTYALYITHPQVLIDPATPVPKWSLSPVGKTRLKAFARSPVLGGISTFFASTETKAMEAAAILAAPNDAAVISGDKFGENDRSSTGFVPADRFEALADAFFAHPDDSVEGWETARAAQNRIVEGIEAALATHGATQPVAFVGHGAVGTLLKCHLGHRPISRSEDQRRLGDPGGGNIFAFRLAERTLLSDWLPMEQFAL